MDLETIARTWDAFKTNYDFQLHAGSSLGLALGFNYYLSKKVDSIRSVAYAALFTFSFGVLKEDYDLLNYGLFSKDDLMRDAFGILLAGAAIKTYRYIVSEQKSLEPLLQE